MDKELKDLTFNELVDWCAWQVMEGLLQGKPLRSVIYTVVDLGARWRKEVDQSEQGVKP